MAGQYLQNFRDPNAMQTIAAHSPVIEQPAPTPGASGPTSAPGPAPAAQGGSPTVEQIMSDPEFHAMPIGERQKVMQSIDPEYAGLPPQEQIRVLEMSQGNQAAEPQGELMASHAPMVSPQPESRFDKTLKGSARVLSPIARPVLEGGGMVGGAAAGAFAGAPAGPGAILTGIAGSAMGYTAGAKAADQIDIWAGKRKPFSGPGELAKSTAENLATGAAYEVGGQAIGPAIGLTAKAIGKVVKPILGRLSGLGKATVETAIDSGLKSGAFKNPIKSLTDFDKALRGKISGEDIVETARDALGAIKENRSANYRSMMGEIEKNASPIDMLPIRKNLKKIMAGYGVKFLPDGKIDTSRIAMGKAGRKDIEEIITTISEWGSKQGDDTAVGLDTLKRQLDDFYSDSSQARSFVTMVRNTVKDTISKAVPEYAELTKGYSEATKLIKDIESGLMLRKQGMTGRVVADQTLRRLMSSMKDNSELRKELVDVLGVKGGKKLSEQIAGYSMKSLLPSGLAGTGPALAAEAAYAHFVNPQFWPVLAASSPRVQAEFLRVLGQGMAAAKAIPKEMVKTGTKLSLVGSETEGIEE